MQLESFIVRGRRTLGGTVMVQGSKNAATKMMVASLLTQERCVIENVPFLSDVDITKELCERVGSKIDFDGKNQSCVTQTQEVTNPLVPQLSRGNRIPILALGPLLHRRGYGEVPVLGGCPIGHRPINFHVEALTQMGVRIERRPNSYYAEAEKIHGAEIKFPYPSVGATENVLLTAVLADGKTRIKNAAIEPEILNLVEMLKAMGGNIKYDLVNRTFDIIGVSSLHGVKTRVMPDRNEIVSLALAVLATHGEIMILDIEESYLKAFLGKLSDIGAWYEVKKNGIKFSGADSYLAALVETAPHPRFMTDWQQPFTVLLTQAEGMSIIHETVYDDRFGYTEDLKRMGADIRLSRECLGSEECRFNGGEHNHSVRIFGPRKLKGITTLISDVRAGMAHLIAALTAEGESVLRGVEHLDRGYEKIDERLRELGADIKRVSSY